MQRKFRITVENKTYNVTVEDIADDGGTLYPSPGLMTAATTPAEAAEAAPAPSAAPETAAAGPGDEVSPLAGVVVSLEVAVGQSVNEGDKIATIEAMKMKTAVVAHRAGSVTNIAVKPGDGVEAGQVLMTIQ